MVSITLVTGEKSEKISVTKNKSFLLPHPKLKSESFLGWSLYENLHHGFMNIIPFKDTDLYAVTTKGPAYILESYFKSVPDDALDSRSHFRRYVIDVYLENCVASSGEFKIENCNYIFYYFGNLSEDGIEVSVTDNTNQRGGAYNKEALFTTSDITVKWQSKQPVDAKKSRRKILSILLSFGKWGMGAEEINRRTSDEIIIPARDYLALADNTPALVSANFFNGVKIDKEIQYKNPALYTVMDETELPDLKFGKLLSHFAVLSDSHVGERYGYKDYNWLYSVFENLKKIHTQKPLDFVLQLGDNIDDGYQKTYEKDYKTYLEVIKKLNICDPLNPVENIEKGKIPHYEIWGNHDTSTDTRFLKEMLWYSPNKKVAFICFFAKYGGYPAVNFEVSKSGESYMSYGILTDETVKFVEDAVLKAVQNGVEQIVLCSHFGIAQNLNAPVLPETGLGKIENICKKHNIKLYLSGHEHNRDYTLREYNGIYNFDAAKTSDGYSVFEIYENYIKATIFNTLDNTVKRIDVLSK